MSKAHSLLLIFLAVLTSYVLIGCGKPVKEEEKLLGTWASKCYQPDAENAALLNDGISALVLSYKNFLYFEKTKKSNDDQWQYTHSVRSYRDAQCSESNLLEARTEAGNYAVEERRMRQGMRYRLRLKVISTNNEGDTVAGRVPVDLTPVISKDGAPSLDHLKKNMQRLSSPRRRQATYSLNESKKVLNIFGRPYSQLTPVTEPSPSPSPSAVD